MTKLNLAVLFGGASSEHDISCISAGNILRGLDAEKYNVFPIGITKNGLWYWYQGDVADLTSGISGSGGTDNWQTHDCTPATLCPGTGQKGITVFENGTVRHLPIDVIFPVLHGKNGEDGTVQGLFELCGIPYVGCGVLGSAVCMDKVMTNLVLDAQGIPRCEWRFIDTCVDTDFDAIEAMLEKALHYPMFVKPANAGSSVGVTRATDKESLRAALRLAAKHDTRILFERAVVGQEVECAVWGNSHVQSTLPCEVHASTSTDFYDYNDKYFSGTSTYDIVAKLPQEVLERVRDTAIRAFRATDCKGLARVDFFVEQGTHAVLVNEINTLPGFTHASMYPKMRTANGVSYAEMLDGLIALALERAEARHA